MLQRGKTGATFPDMSDGFADTFLGMNRLRPDTATIRPVRVHAGIRDITVPVCKDAVGYRVKGARPGPTVIVAGYDANCDEAFRRVLVLPGLPWMQGDLNLLRMQQNSAVSDALLIDLVAAQLGRVDRTLQLTSGNSTELYWTILRFCARCGMISGRGVPEWRPSDSSDHYRMPPKI